MSNSYAKSRLRSRDESLVSQPSMRTETAYHLVMMGARAARP